MYFTRREKSKLWTTERCTTIQEKILFYIQPLLQRQRMVGKHIFASIGVFQQTKYTKGCTPRPGEAFQNQQTSYKPTNIQQTSYKPTNQQTSYKPTNILQTNILQTNKHPTKQQTNKHPPNQQTNKHPTNQQTNKHPPNQQTNKHPTNQQTSSKPTAIGVSQQPKYHKYPKYTKCNPKSKHHET